MAKNEFAFSFSNLSPFNYAIRGQRTARSHNFVYMSSHTFSRRQVGRLLFGVSAAALATVIAAAPHLTIADTTTRPTFMKDESGISYFDVKVGSGATPVDGDFVIVDYMAFLSNGKVFDNRKGFVFQLGRLQVIPGLEYAIKSMRPGGERKVVVPPKLAYGNKGVCLNDSKECLVPPNETLGFSVTLQRVAIPPA